MNPRLIQSQAPLNLIPMPTLTTTTSTLPTLHTRTFTDIQTQTQTQTQVQTSTISTAPSLPPTSHAFTFLPPNLTTDPTPACPSIQPYRYAIIVLATIIGVTLLLLAFIFGYMKPKKWEQKGAASRDTEMEKLKRENDELRGGGGSRATAAAGGGGAGFAPVGVGMGMGMPMPMSMPMPGLGVGVGPWARW